MCSLFKILLTYPFTVFSPKVSFSAIVVIFEQSIFYALNSVSGTPQSQLIPGYYACYVTRNGEGAAYSPLLEYIV
jgi:hypothetical protein